MAGDTSNVAQKAADMSSRIQMGNNLENFYYCQIPFEINRQQNTAELYVFERKKGSSGEGERVNSTILIALETQNMGRVETVMRAESDVISIEFRVESKPVQGYLQKEAEELEELLWAIDFDVKEVRVVMMETPATPLNVDQVLGEKEIFNLQTVDISI
jgi:hypothetical protein